MHTKKDALHDIEELNIEEIKDMSDGLKLTDKQRLFCFYYSRCLNATKAYQKAYGCTYIEAARQFIHFEEKRGRKQAYR